MNTCPICKQPAIDSTDIATRPVGAVTPTTPLTSCVKCFKVASAIVDTQALGEQVISGNKTRLQAVTAALA